VGGHGYPKIDVSIVVVAGFLGVGPVLFGIQRRAEAIVAAVSGHGGDLLRKLAIHVYPRAGTSGTAWQESNGT
jgi:hypothetical protein